MKANNREITNGKKIIEDKGNDDHEEEDYEDNITEVVEPIPPTEHPNNIEDIYHNFELKKVEARTSENFTQLTFQEMVTIYHDIWNTMLVWEPHQPPAPVPEDKSMIAETEDSQSDSGVHLSSSVSQQKDHL